MSEDRATEIRRRLDEGLSIAAFEDDPRPTEEAATRFFQDVFVRLLDFDTGVAGTGQEPWHDLPAHRWRESTRANAARLVAEAGDFRVVYVELEGLTRAAERNTIRSLAQSDRRGGWAIEGTFLAVFHAPGEDTWHLVTPYEDGTDDITTGRPVLRRYTLGAGATHRTVGSALADVDASRGRLAERIDQAFSVEAVTEEFYQDYKNAFDTLGSELRENGLEIDDADRYAHVTLNRLVCLYFLQEDGWMGERSDFLRWFLERYDASDDTDRFHEDWLAALFFAGLSPATGTPIDAELPDEVDEMVSGLSSVNVGLFQPSELDENGAFVSDAALDSVIRDFLERYNFTVTEESPYDIDIAVDPAMLGRIYESLVAEQERGEAGIFYTPRVEVDLLCRMALYEQLCEHADGVAVDGTRWIVEFVFSEPGEWDPEDTVETGELEGILQELRIVDPACGSGAFLVGMKQVLSELYGKLGITPGYHRESRIIDENLHGVDITDWAVRVAELRLWLSVVESEDDLPEEKPVLPDRSFDLEVGDSIVQPVDGDHVSRAAISGPDGQIPNAGESKHRDGRMVDAPSEGKADRSSASSSDGFRWERDFPEVMSNGGFDVVIGNPPYVRQEDIIDQRIDPGRLEEMDAAVVQELKDRYKSRLRDYAERTFDIEPYKRSDIYLYFFFRGIEILRPGGTLAFVTSNSWLDVDYGRRLQEGFLKLGRLEHVLDNRTTRSFEEAAVNTVVTVVNRASVRELAGEVSFTAVDRPYSTLLDSTTFADVLGAVDRGGSGIDIEGERIEVRTQDRFRTVSVSEPALWRLGGGTTGLSGADGDRLLPGGSYSDGGWGRFVRAPDEYFELLNEFGAELSRVDDVARVRRGITSGANDFFYLPAPGAETAYFEASFDHAGGQLQLFLKDEGIRSEFASQGFTVMDPMFEIEHEYVMHEADLSADAAAGRVPFHYEDERGVWIPNLLVKSPREIEGLTIEHEPLTRVLLRANGDRSELDPGVRAYIEWGETWEPGRGSTFAERRTCTARTPWYDLGEIAPAELLFPRRIWSSYAVALNDLRAFDNDTLFGLHTEDPRALRLVLNSSVTWLFLEVTARSSLGQGVLDTDVNMLEDLRVPDPSVLPSGIDPHLDVARTGLYEQLGTSDPAEVDLSDVAEPLRTVDDVVLSEGLGVGDELRERIYRALLELVDDRIEKSRSV